MCVSTREVIFRARPWVVAAVAFLISQAAAPAQVGAHSVSLSWTASTSVDVVGYNVYRGTEATGPFSELTASPVAGTSFTDQAPPPGADFYVATAVDASGNESVFSAPAEAIVPSVSISTPSPLPAGTAGIAYSLAMQATGGTQPYRWSIVSGALPGGLTLGSDGTISGTPAAAGTFSFTAEVTDAASWGATAVVALTIHPALTITTSSQLPAGVAGAAYSARLAAAGGTPSYAWSLAGGSLPAGLALDAQGGISGTPLLAGSSSFRAQVRDAAASTASGAFSLAVGAAPPLSVTTVSPLPAGLVGRAYELTFATSGGVAPFLWSLTRGALPSGLTLSPGGMISGTPATAGIYTFTVLVRQSVMPTGTISAIAAAERIVTFSLTVGSSSSLVLMR